MSVVFPECTALDQHQMSWITGTDEERSWLAVLWDLFGWTQKLCWLYWQPLRRIVHPQRCKYLSHPDDIMDIFSYGSTNTGYRVIGTPYFQAPPSWFLYTHSGTIQNSCLWYSTPTHGCGHKRYYVENNTRNVSTSAQHCCFIRTLDHCDSLSRQTAAHLWPKTPPVSIRIEMTSLSSYLSLSHTHPHTHTYLALIFNYFEVSPLSVRLPCLVSTQTRDPISLIIIDDSHIPQRDSRGRHCADSSSPRSQTQNFVNVKSYKRWGWVGTAHKRMGIYISFPKPLSSSNQNQAPCLSELSVNRNFS